MPFAILCTVFSKNERLNAILIQHTGSLHRFFIFHNILFVNKQKQEQEERQYNLKIDGKDVDDLTGKMVELVGTSIPIGVTESGVSTFDVLA